MTGSEKLDLLLNQMNSMSHEMLEMRQEVKQVNERVEQVSDRVEQVSEQVKQVSERVEQVSERVEQVSERVSKTNMLIEQDISKKIDVIGEGHDFLKQRLGEALQMEKKRESMELELINLRMDVNKIKDKLDIA